jgi:phage-related minor tail protein
MDLTEKITEIGAKLEALQQQAADAVTNVSDAAEAKAILDGTDDQPGLRAQVDVLTRERDALLDKKALEETRSALTTLEGAIADLRKPAGEFKPFGASEDETSGKAVADDDPYKEYAESRP